MPRSPKPKRPKTSADHYAEARARGWQDPLRQQQPLVSGKWLLRAFAITVAIAAVCTYLTLCLLFVQGQWQVIFHPSRKITTTPAMLGLKYDEVGFDYSESGISQLAGWWIPAASGGRYAGSTLLFLHDGSGSLSDVAQQLAALHSLGINVFAFDYRGFGHSADVHPSERRVYEDADAAWNYLTGTRHLDPKSIVLYGVGLGAVVAAETVLRHAEASALILENPTPSALEMIQADTRTKLLPAKLLFRDRFDLATKLPHLTVRKLLIASNHRSAKATRFAVGPTTAVWMTAPPSKDPQYLKVTASFLCDCDTEDGDSDDD